MPGEPSYLDHHLFHHFENVHLPFALDYQIEVSSFAVIMGRIWPVLINIWSWWITVSIGHKWLQYAAKYHILVHSIWPPPDINHSHFPVFVFIIYVLYTHNNNYSNNNITLFVFHIWTCRIIDLLAVLIPHFSSNWMFKKTLTLTINEQLSRILKLFFFFWRGILKLGSYSELKLKL